MIWPLQSLRFAAALMVVYVHACQLARQVTGSNGLLPPQFQLSGWAGVDLFFVISGVIIARTAPSLSWPDFAWKRFSRIVPLYYLFSLLAVAIAVRSGSPLAWRDILATVFLWPATDVMTLPAMGVAWTLCFEALFYAAAALVLADRRWLMPVVGLFLASMALRPAGAVFQFLGNPIIFEFLFGVAIACLPSMPQAKWAIPAGALAIASAGSLGLAPLGSSLEFLKGDDGFLRVVVYGLPAALIVYGAIQFKAGPNFWTRQGDASYALYLSHSLLIPALAPLWKVLPAPADVVILAAIAASVSFAWRFHLAVEVPVLKTLRHVWRRPRLTISESL